MARTAGTLTNNNFTKGLVTEFSPFSFPQGACEETFDCIHDITGSVESRPGFDLENNYSVKAIDKTDGVVNSYLWKDVAGDGNISLLVLQVKDILYFYDASTTDPLSSHAISDQIDLNTFLASGAPNPKTEECQFASGNGKLFVSHPFLEPFSVAYDTNTRTFTATEITLQMRDFEGLDDGYAVDARPSTGWSGLSTAHKYNLLNQGWTQTNIDAWDAARTDLPSNVDVMWLFKNSSDNFDTTKIDKVVKGNSPAPKGHFILDVNNQDRNAASGLGVATVTTGYQRPSTIAFFSGRIFYAGINYTGYNSNIYFSQIIERDAQFGACYQANDPTSETSFDLLATDGGVIKIQEAGTIHKLFPVPGGLAIFASNGVWMITGSTGLGFTASDYTVAKISAINTLTHTSFVDAAGVPMWWNLEGIYRMEGSQGGMQVVPMTATTIKSFYDDIPPSEKRNVRGYFNPLAYTVQWLYKSTESADLESYYEYDRVLNFDVRTGAFFPWKIPTHAIKVHGMVVLENRGGAVALENVTTIAGETVTDNLLDTVQVWSIGDSIVTPAFKYIVSYNSTGDKFTFAESKDVTHYKDWYSYDSTGVTFDPYFISGITLPNPTTDFESNYLTLFTDNNSKLYIQGLWDFSSTTNSSRWSIPQLVDTTSQTEYDNVISRRKIRGRGKALKIKIRGYTSSAFLVEGWGMYITGNQNP